MFYARRRLPLVGSWLMESTRYRLLIARDFDEFYVRLFVCDRHWFGEKFIERFISFALRKSCCCWAAGVGSSYASAMTAFDDIDNDVDNLVLNVFATAVATASVAVATALTAPSSRNNGMKIPSKVRCFLRWVCVSRRCYVLYIGVRGSCMVVVSLCGWHDTRADGTHTSIHSPNSVGCTICLRTQSHFWGNISGGYARFMWTRIVRETHFA